MTTTWLLLRRNPGAVTIPDPVDPVEEGVDAAAGQPIGTCYGYPGDGTPIRYACVDLETFQSSEFLQESFSEARRFEALDEAEVEAEFGLFLHRTLAN